VSAVRPDPLRWIFLREGPRSGAENMARDEALARYVADAAQGGAEEARPALLRFYAWERPTLSFGRNEPARPRFDPERLAHAGIDVVRRPTGGRAVLHDREVTYAVAVPVRALGGPRDTYRRINEVLAVGLGALGVEVSLAPDVGTVPLDAGPCFDRPAAGEVVARGRKLVGSAQVRVGDVLLQHGSILLHDDQSRIDELATPASRSARDVSRPVALADLIARPPGFDDVTAAIAEAARDLLPWAKGDWRAPEDGAMFAVDATFEAERRAHHTDPEWIWRR